MNDREAAEQAIHQIAETLRAYLHCSEPRPGQNVCDTAMSELLGDLGTRVFSYAKGLEPGKFSVLADVLSGIACCMAGMPEGVPQTECQSYSSEMILQLRTVVAAHCKGGPFLPESEGNHEAN